MDEAVFSFMSSAPVFWFTGLSGSGETTVADAAKEGHESRHDRQ